MKQESQKEYLNGSYNTFINLINMLFTAISWKKQYKLRGCIVTAVNF